LSALMGERSLSIDRCENESWVECGNSGCEGTVA
jgi:hypothetical protein